MKLFFAAFGVLALCSVLGVCLYLGFRYARNWFAGAKKGKGV